MILIFSWLDQVVYPIILYPVESHEISPYNPQKMDGCIPPFNAFGLRATADEVLLFAGREAKTWWKTDFSVEYHGKKKHFFLHKGLQIQW